MLMSSGTLFGLKKTLPHILGIVSGFVTLLAMAVYGLAQVILQLPWLLLIIKLFGAVWLSWLAYQFIRASNSISEAEDENQTQASTSARPLTFIEAFGFQWANPKALVNATSCAGAFVAIAQTPSHKVMIMGSVFAVVGLATSTLWTLMGRALQQYLTRGRLAIWVNRFMAVLILFTALTILFV